MIILFNKRPLYNTSQFLAEVSQTNIMEHTIFGFFPNYHDSKIEGLIYENLQGIKSLIYFKSVLITGTKKS